MEQWASGTFQHETASTTSDANASALGELGTYTQLIELSYEEFKGAMTDE